MLWAAIGRRPYDLPNFRGAVWVLVAFIPQFFAFVLHSTRDNFPTPWIPAVLVSSQGLLLLFSILNIRQPGMWLLGLGLTLNLLVIALNGGMMPISPETIQHLYPDASVGAWQVGQRLGVGKDVVLPVAQTRLWILSDHYTLPAWLGYKVAFSLGDGLIALGAFWLLFNFDGRHGNKELTT